MNGIGEHAAPARYLQDLRYEPAASGREREDWEAHGRQALQEAVRELNDRDRAIITERWLREEKTTLQDLADRYGISAERVRQLEGNALRKLRRSIET